VRRREVVVAAAGAAVLARPAVARAQAAIEADVLTRALRLELTTMFAYDTIGIAGVLDGAAARRLRRLRGHEAEHAAALARALADLGSPQPPPPRDVTQVEVPEIRAGLDGLSGRDDALALLVSIERLSVAAQRAALARLRDVRHIQLAATILAAEAAHLVAWRTVR
jgi:hypothetical protein